MRLPLDFEPISNGEYAPPAMTEKERAMQALARELVEDKRQVAGMDRRSFLISTCGMAVCLSSINRVSAATGGRYLLPQDALVDPEAAGAVLSGSEFIFDIQTHHVMPGEDWEQHNPAMKTLLQYLPGESDFGRHAFIKEIFLDSDTTCAVLSAVPATPEGQPLPAEEAEITRRILETLGGSPRLYVHALVTPNLGELDRNLAGMEAVKERFPIAAWKVYTLFGERGGGYWLDGEEYGLPMLEKMREIGPKIVCMHKGIPLAGSYGAYHRSRDVGVVAKKFPDLRFIAYHAGYNPGLREGPYDSDQAEDGVDALIRSMHDNEVEPNTNVYAELGSTWWMLMKKPEQAAHVLGKLLKYVGEDNVLWGTDSIWYGSPQPQLAAFRAFQISPQLRERHGYPELTPALKAKVLGLNAAKVYGVEPDAALPKIKADEVERLKNAYLPERSPSHQLYGPRTRREFLALLARRGGMPA